VVWCQRFGNRQIAEVSSVIANVAKRTTLLALNATIEASRADEAGLDFAVVAGEVKALASETTVSTGTINQRIERITVETTRARDSIAAIVIAIGRIGEAQQSIAASIEEQSAVSENVARNLNGLGDSNRIATEASAHLATSAREFLDLADSLRGLVSTYRL